MGKKINILGGTYVARELSSAETVLKKIMS